MAYCSACGEELPDDPDPEDIHDPQEGEPSESAHIEAVHRETGTVMKCREKNQFTSIQPNPPQEEGEGGGGNEGNEKTEPEPQPQRPQPRQQRPVYDLPDEKDAEDILKEVVSNPSYQLDEDQIREVMSWGEIYDGQVPPDQLEAILSNLSGVSNQKANLVRQKYEARLNKWVRQQSEGSGGPSLGGVSAPIPMNNGPKQIKPPSPSQFPSGQSRGQPSRGPPQGGGNSSPSPPDNPLGSDQDGPDESKSMDLGSEGSNTPSSKRKTRRKEAMDKAAEEFALKAADNMADGFGQSFQEFRNLFFKIMNSKAENDPEWFFEKMEKWDMNLVDEVMSESSAKQEQEEQRTSQADMEVDNALESVMEDEYSSQPSPEPTQTQQTEPTQTEPVGDEFEMEAPTEGESIQGGERTISEEPEVQDTVENEQARPEGSPDPQSSEVEDEEVGEFANEIDEMLEDIE